MTTTREAALEAALKLARNRLQACAIDYPTGSREMAERSEWADEATAALSTPATEPQGYVDELIEKLRAGVVQCGLHEDNNTELFDIEDANEAMFEAAQALAASPAPQPAADTRVVTVGQLERWCAYAEDGLVSTPIREIRAIIGTATPAPSDKIAEAALTDTALREAIARAWCHEENVAKEMDVDLADAVLWEIRALAGKGE